MQPRLTAVTLGVRDVKSSAKFYEAFGFVRKVRATGDEVVFLDAGGTVLALYPWHLLAEDAQLAAAPLPSAFRGSTRCGSCRRRACPPR
jgi:catechol 2,3-dioxygenase-like lactoylglutathione lyase family enzyme